ncbi:hypothetical protein BATDEDRAFT_28040 [Batrachochytrium dendrobatidis JAM81]|uniref:FAM192A/Fyv6 N-terminal domain-containing protein n=2 Tax=Batrachochytrium dendrobatidis TaxID=109871 RepID=F4PCN1_BATDJ|nr:uncharacterized protein BATDEDRAFT_28040 [Batrachochytrium dendrobatidis JAM81]EGF76975.1 hypothetical protein BATDEDRAFT_28040 [Batrachochytrium dendrobatidis JAM81]OAJ44987.1 hypothetical protein BDEG_28158 [Batrachochytrium dendrobatidis JEL423]|eukprot:XP_006682391.1 hypothetical protein BATDEDRAFT_28040 [Batrachochytrium dendrobatidis JAM81]
MSEGFFSKSLGTKTETSVVAVQMASKFVTEKELGNQDQTKEPDAEYDPRPLFEKLAEKKQLQDEEFAEKMKFSNQIKLLDSDEVEFLTHAKSLAAAKERDIKHADQAALDEFRNAKISTVTHVLDSADRLDSNMTFKPTQPIHASHKNVIQDTQKSILLKGVKRKSTLNTNVSSHSTTTDSPKRTKHSIDIKSNAVSCKPTSTVLTAMINTYESSDEDE